MPYVKAKQWSAATNMAAGKIQRAFRSSRFRSAINSRVAAKATVNQVANLAAKKVMKKAETKSFINGFTCQPLAADVYCTNLVYGIAQGVTAENIIGEKFNLRSIHIKGTMSTINPNNINTKFFRIVVFRSKKALTNSGTTITTTDLFRSTSATVYPVNSWHVDLHKVDLLYDRTYSVTPTMLSTAGTNTQVLARNFDLKLNINKTHFFDTDNSGYLKDKNYYLAFIHDDNQEIAGGGQFYFTYTVNYKDE